MNKIRQAIKIYKNSIIIVNKYSNEIVSILSKMPDNLDMNVYMYYKVGA